MKVFWGLAGLALVGLFAFQNCNRLPSSVGQAPDGRQDALVSKIDMNMADVETIGFNVRQVQVMNSGGNDYSVVDNKHLSLNMETGVLTETSEMSSDVRTFCMPDAMKSELMAIMESSQVCKWGNVSGPGVMCGMAIREPYAEVRLVNEVMNLGSATDTCGNNAVDLCDSNGELLRAFRDKLAANYTTYICN